MQQENLKIAFKHDKESIPGDFKRSVVKMTKGWSILVLLTFKTGAILVQGHELRNKCIQINQKRDKKW